MATEPIPERITIETDALALQRARPRSGLLGLGAFGMYLLPLVIMMVGGGLFGMQKPDAWSSIVGASWTIATFTTLLAGIARAAEAARRGQLVIEDGALELGWGTSRRKIPMGAVVGGSVTPRAGGALLTLSLADGRNVSARVPSEAAAARALEALRIDPMGRALQGRFRSGLLRSFAGFAAALALFLLGAWLKAVVDIGTVSGLIWLSFCIVFVGAWLASTRQPEIAVGADGVRIRGKLGARFIPLAEIESAETDGLSQLVLKLEGGKEYRTTVALGNGPMLAAIAHRIGLAKAASPSMDEARSRLSLLSRGARTLGAWRDDLRSRVRNADYRNASLADGELAEIVGSSGASAEHRIGAAIALREARGEDARSEIRIAAEQCVNPHVRIALERIADGGDARRDGADEGRAADEEERALEEALRAENVDAEAGKKRA